MIIKEAKYEDFEKVYPLLQKLNNTSLSKKHWQKLFKNNFNTEENFCGYLIEDNEKVEGFLGAVFSEREIAGKKYKFCNTSSWIVNEKYRSKSLLLLMKVHKLKDYIFTNFTPSETVYPILKKLGYEDIDNKKVLLKPVPVLTSKIKIKINRFEEILNDAEIEIYKTHKNFNLGFFIAQKGNDYCFVAYRKKKYLSGKLKKLTANKINFTLAEVEYISNKELFAAYYKEILFKASLKQKLAGFAVYKKHLRKTTAEKAKQFKTHRKFVYKGELPISEIDILFSEIMILDI